MAIYRGPGGAGDAVADTTNQSAVAVAKAAEAAASAADAATSASEAAASASDAASSAASVGDSATAAASSATAAASSATSASTSAAAASSSASSASTSASAAATSATAAASSASSAATSATAAATSETNAAESETNAATSATSAQAAATAAAAAQTAAEAAEASTVDFQENLAVEISTLSAGASATVSYDSNTTTMSFGIPAGAAGATGADGDPGLVWQGAYDNATAYAVNDAISYNGSSYICIQASTGNLPTNASYWNLIAEKGASGEGTGDVIGPASSTNGNFASFNGTSGKEIADSTYSPASFATAAQGSLADSAVQPGDLATVATTGAYTDLTGTPTLGTAAAEDTTAFATAAQGALADSALQSSDIGTTVQSYDANTAKYNDTTANFTGTLQNGGHTVLTNASDYLDSADIGVNVQAYDSNLAAFVSTFTVPETDGTAGQALITNGSGTIAFGNVDALPSQSGNSGKYLTTDGTTASWGAIETPGTSFTRTKFTATASQTTFTVDYTSPYLQVFHNGVQLVYGTDYTATNGTSVVLATGAAEGDIVEVYAFDAFSVADTYTQAQADALFQPIDADTAKLDVAQTFTAPQTMTALKETKVAVSAAEIDLATGNYFTKTVSANITFTVANVASSGSVSAFVLDLTNGGAATVTWWSGITWNAATAPTLTASGVDTLAFFTYDGGTTWRGFVLGQGMA